MSTPLDLELRGYSETGHANPSKHVILGWSKQVSVLMAKLEAMEQIRKQAQLIMDEAPNQDADAVPDWLDTMLGSLSLALAAQQEGR